MTQLDHQLHSIGPEVAGSRIFKFIGFLYGIAAYLVFFVTILYAIGFVMGLVVPKTIDTGTDTPTAEAVIINLLLMTLFAVQHSVMARKQFKAWWTQFVPKPVERSTYVLFASLSLLLLFWQWRPMPAVVWDVGNPDLAVTLVTLSLAGWVLVFASTFIINHFELFGLHQVTNHLVGNEAAPPRFKTPLFYKFVRHPIYLGFIIAFWARAGHDGGPSAVRGRDHALHLRRHRAGGARPRRSLRRRIPAVQTTGVDAYSLAQIGIAVASFRRVHRKEDARRNRSA
ncbi:protein-S-isoprenylcysteine O-methyltransferase Ste14 [Bradyrhizobium sp. i1.3.1]